AGGNKIEGCTRQALVIHAGMLKEPIILRRQKSLNQDLRDLFIGHWQAQFTAKSADQLTVGGINAQRLVNGGLGDRIGGRQLFAVIQKQANGHADSEQQRRKQRRKQGRQRFQKWR